MRRIDGNIVFDRHLNYPCLRRLTADLFETMEQKRMVGDDKIATEHNSLIDHISRNVCGQEDGADITSCVTYLHSRVIPLLLGTPWRYRFYDINNGS